MPCNHVRESSGRICRTAQRSSSRPSTASRQSSPSWCAAQSQIMRGGFYFVAGRGCLRLVEARACVFSIFQARVLKFCLIEVGVPPPDSICHASMRFDHALYIWHHACALIMHYMAPDVQYLYIYIYTHTHVCIAGSECSERQELNQRELTYVPVMAGERGAIQSDGHYRKSHPG